MVEMNLFGSPSYIVGNYPTSGVKKGAGVVFLLAVILLIPLLSVALVKVYFEMTTAQKLQSAPPAAVVSVIEAQIEEMPLRSVAEDIANIPAARRSPDLTRPTEIAQTDYEDMGMWEQLNFEVKFTALALEEFSRLSPPELTFNTIRVFDYKGLIAEGTSPDRASLSSGLLVRLRNEREWEIMPRPKTNIRDGKTFYHFRLEAQFTPEMTRLVANPINPDNRPDLAHLNGLKDRIVRLARTSGLKNVSRMNLLTSVNEPDEKVFVYNLKFSGDFPGILNFLKALSIMHEPVSCRNISLTKGKNRIDASATLVVVLR